MVYFSTSKRILRIPGLGVFLESNDIRHYRRKSSIGHGSGEAVPFSFVGWGHKGTSTQAQHLANQYQVPYTALEDGFLRSLRLGFDDPNLLSLISDSEGIYYDATSPSVLENILNTDNDSLQSLLRDARKAISEIIKHDLSKYNRAPCLVDSKIRLGKRDSQPRVLLVDQTLGDASVSLGLADAGSFRLMLSEAKRTFPKAHFYIKTHPDVVAGKKKGYLTDVPETEGFTLIDHEVSPLSLLTEMDIVFCVSSQMGFEALMLGKPVYCFGMPFYAGWGLTHDHLKCPRRKARRTLEELFAAAYILYPTYIDPIRKERTDVFHTIDRLGLQRSLNEENRGAHACYGFSFWKHPHAIAFTQSTGARHAFFKHFNAKERSVRWAKENAGDVIVWSSRCLDGTLQRLCDENQIPLLRMEDGFIRSIGLGSDFNWPCSLVLDKSGIYYDCTRPSDLESILNTFSRRDDVQVLRVRARNLMEKIVRLRLTKYNVGVQSFNPAQLPKGKTIILVPGQVEDDASVRTGGCGITTNIELLRRVRERESEAYILYKPHPDVEAKNRKGAVADSEILQFADRIVRDVRMDVLIDHVDEVHTLTSLAGFEALLRKKKVVTYGGPFYAGWGLTLDRANPSESFFARRTARPTLEELIAGTLILYPRYFDWRTQNFCTVEDVCYRLSEGKGQIQGKWLLFLFSKIRNRFRKWL